MTRRMKYRKCASTARRPKQIGRQYLQCACDRFQSPQTYLSLASFHFADVILAKARVFRQINLSPSALLSKRSDSLPNANTDIGCHPSSIAIICDLESLHTGTGPTFMDRKWRRPFTAASNSHVVEDVHWSEYTFSS